MAKINMKAKNRKSIINKLSKIKIGGILKRSDMTDGESAVIYDYISNMYLVRTSDNSLIKLDNIDSEAWIDTTECKREIYEFWINQDEYNNYIPTFFAVMKEVDSVEVGDIIDMEEVENKYPHLKKNSLCSYMYSLMRCGYLSSRTNSFLKEADISHIYTYSQIKEEDRFNSEYSKEEIARRKQGMADLRELAKKAGLLPK